MTLHGRTTGNEQQILKKTTKVRMVVTVESETENMACCTLASGGKYILLLIFIALTFFIQREPTILLLHPFKFLCRMLTERTKLELSVLLLALLPAWLLIQVCRNRSQGGTGTRFLCVHQVICEYVCITRVHGKKALCAH